MIIEGVLHLKGPYKWYRSVHVGWHGRMATPGYNSGLNVLDSRNRCRSWPIPDFFELPVKLQVPLCDVPERFLLFPVLDMRLRLANILGLLRHGSNGILISLIQTTSFIIASGSGSASRAVIG